MGAMTGQLGPYAMTRDASGTAWSPDAAPMAGVMLGLGGWTAMASGFVTVLDDSQGGPRGGRKTFSLSMAMLMASHDLAGGRLTLRAMGSLDPLMGRAGYPLLLQTGETADGRTPLVDRQHPHDAVMELAGVYSRPLARGLGGFIYLGWPGEPAIGPPVYMSRPSGALNPEAPIGHHWLDSTHVSFGVATAGLVAGGIKIEASQFTGREPNAYRWDLDHPRFDSTSVRLAFNPLPTLSLQLSRADIKSPEALTPLVNQTRTTASISVDTPARILGAEGRLSATLAAGQDHDAPGRSTTAWLAETTVRRGAVAVFGRAERVTKDDLLGSALQSPLAGRSFDVGKLSLGGTLSRPLPVDLIGDIGLLFSLYDLPGVLRPTYGSAPVSVIAFLRVRLGD